MANPSNRKPKLSERDQEDLRDIKERAERVSQIYNRDLPSSTRMARILDMASEDTPMFLRGVLIPPSLFSILQDFVETFEQNEKDAKKYHESIQESIRNSHQLMAGVLRNTFDGMEPKDAYLHALAEVGQKICTCGHPESSHIGSGDPPDIIRSPWCRDTDCECEEFVETDPSLPEKVADDEGTGSCNCHLQAMASCLIHGLATD